MYHMYPFICPLHVPLCPIPAVSDLFEHLSVDRVEPLPKAQSLAKLHLPTAQTKMKEHFDKRSVKREFRPGDPVLVLLPTPGSISHAKFSGPYLVKRKLNNTNFLVATPDQKLKSRVCHINKLKAYVDKALSEVTLQIRLSVLRCLPLLPMLV